RFPSMRWPSLRTRSALSRTSSKLFCTESIMKKAMRASGIVRLSGSIVAAGSSCGSCRPVSFSLRIRSGTRARVSDQMMAPVSRIFHNTKRSKRDLFDMFLIRNGAKLASAPFFNLHAASMPHNEAPLEHRGPRNAPQHIGTIGKLRHIEHPTVLVRAPLSGHHLPPLQVLYHEGDRPGGQALHLQMSTD